MIKGTLDGSVSRLYCYYHGPMRAVLSDTSLPPVIRGTELAATGGRIVFIPNEWTELNFMDIREKWNSGNSQLNHLESSGYLDIYTSKEEADKVKLLLKDFHLPENLKHGQYIKAFEDKDIIKKYLESKEKAEQEFVMQPKHYFDLDKGMGGSSQSVQKNTETIYNVNTDTSKFDKIVELVQKQAEQTTKQTEQMTKMMETMQQVMLAMVNQINNNK